MKLAVTALRPIKPSCFNHHKGVSTIQGPTRTNTIVVPKTLFVNFGRKSIPQWKINKRFFATESNSNANNERRVKIYTKTGDKGTTSLFNGERRSKSDPVFEALGHTDELNSAIGVAREFCKGVDDTLCNRLETIQSILLDVGSNIATPRLQSSDAHKNRTKFDGIHVTRLEQWIDEMEAALPPLTNFILPSGGKGSAFLHLSRSICRRAERSVVPLAQEGNVEAEVEMFMNRLSDFLFVAARFVAKKEGATEVIYKKPQVK